MSPPSPLHCPLTNLAGMRGHRRTNSSMHSAADARVTVGSGGDVNGIHPVTSPRLAPETAPATVVPATIVINASSPAPVRALSLGPLPTPMSPEAVVSGDPAQISATRLLELMSGKQQSPKNEAERDILVRGH